MPGSSFAIVPAPSPLSMWLEDFQLVYLLVGLAGVALVWRCPRPAAVVGLVLGLNLAAWAAYVAPLGRLYSLAEPNDRSFNVALAATVAAGNSPFEHVQVGLASLEPFWDVFVAALALFDPQRVLGAYELMAPLSIIGVALGLYLGLRSGSERSDQWERAIIVLAVLGLASMSMSHQSPIVPFWTGNFLFKPNHGGALGVACVAVGLRARGARWWAVGLCLGLLAWTFVLTWVYVMLALAIGTMIRPREERDWRELALAFGLSAVVVSPDLANLLRDYGPLAPGKSPDQVWRGAAPLARVLARPYWVTGDLGPLLALGAAGAAVVWRRGSRRDALLLGLLGAAWLLWAGSVPAAILGFALEADEIHYYVRLAMGLCAAAALAAAARHVESWRGLSQGRGHLIVLAACWPLTFPAYFNPLRMDRFYPASVAPIGEAQLEYGRWVAQHTAGDAVFLAGPAASSWIGVLSGRRVLLCGEARPPADYERRKQAEELMLTSLDAGAIHRVAEQMGIDYVAIDPALAREYGNPLPRLGESEVYERVYDNAGVVIWKILEPS